MNSPDEDPMPEVDPMESVVLFIFMNDFVLDCCWCNEILWIETI